MKAGLPLLALTLVITACAPAAKAPPEPAAARPAARPAMPPAAQPAASAALPAAAATGWMDMPRSPGTWRYGVQGNTTEASFVGPAGAPLARLTCLADSRLVVLSLADSGAARPVVTIRTETATRALEPRRGEGAMSIALAPADRLLDAMALSKGHFAVESDGLPPLYLPSWAEVSRVIEDCR
jgi:hypothetical protein